VIRFATKRRLTTLLIGVLILLGTGVLATKLKTNFLDQSGQDSLNISQEMPVGTSLAATDAAAKKVEAILAGRDDVKTYQVTVGNGEFNPFAGGGGASAASYQVALEESADAEVVGNALRAEFKNLSGVGEVTVGQDSGLGGSGLAVNVQAADAGVLATATQQVQQAMTATAGINDVSTTLAASVPRLDVQVKREEAARRGLTEQAVGQSVAAAFRSAPAGQITVNGTSEDVVVSFTSAPGDKAALSALPITTPQGVVRLDQVADIKEVAGPEQVTRVDGDRTATVKGTAASGSSLSKINTELKKNLSALTLPAGASYSIGGASADQADAFKQLGLAVLAAIAIVFIIMVATFRSLVQPIILLVSIPFAATGAIVLLLVTGTALGVPALIGVLMLVGIVVTNAIVLMDLINHYRAEGMGVQEAVIEGGRHRLRPILMTAIATIFALLPMALGLTGEGGFISQPLAIVVIGGLVSSTLLTLVLVPTLYTMVENRKEKRRAKRAARRLAKAGGDLPADDEPRHAANEPDLVTADAAATSARSGGAHEAK
jgi:HAE1 family hydrophobic/amphiphilic exporter-1